MWTSHHCRHCGDKHLKGSPSIKRWSMENLLEAVKQKISSIEKGKHFRKEDIARELRAKTSMVEVCLQKLNLMGKVSQPSHRAPHDSARGIMGWGNDSAWMADIYWKR